MLSACRKFDANADGIAVGRKRNERLRAKGRAGEEAEKDVGLNNDLIVNTRVPLGLLHLADSTWLTPLGLLHFGLPANHTIAPTVRSN